MNVSEEYVKYVIVYQPMTVYVVRFVLIGYVSTKINHVLMIRIVIMDWEYVRFIGVYGELMVCHVNLEQNVMV
jgi:hypothetical protein